MRVTTIPSSDHAFALAVDVIVRANARLNASQLQSLLRPMYPQAAVIPSALSGDAETAYVYRDGSFELESTEMWWHGDDAARAVVSASTGVLLDVSDAWQDQFGPPHELIGRHFSDLVHPDARSAAEALFQALMHHAEVRTTILVRGHGGSALPVKVRALRDGDEIVVYYRPA